ncbi:MAG: Sec-independent protein translocase protein TatB [Pseudomonadota bacterium]
MFDIGWSEMAIIAFVALIVFGPKELPNALRTGARWLKSARKMAREFQNSVDQLVREAELEEAKKLVVEAQRGGVDRAIEKTIDPTGEVKEALDPKALEREANAGGEVKPQQPPVAAEPVPMVNEPVPMPAIEQREPESLAAPSAAPLPTPASEPAQPRPAPAGDAAVAASTSSTDGLQKTA